MRTLIYSSETWNMITKKNWLGCKIKSNVASYEKIIFNKIWRDNKRAQWIKIWAWACDIAEESCSQKWNGAGHHHHYHHEKIYGSNPYIGLITAVVSLFNDDASCITIVVVFWNFSVHVSTFLWHSCLCNYPRTSAKSYLEICWSE